MSQTVFYILEAVSCLVLVACGAITLRYYMHMLQLASYQLPGYYLHLKQEKKHLWYSRILGIYCFVMLSVFDNGSAHLMSCGENHLSHTFFYLSIAVFMVTVVCALISVIRFFMPKDVKKKFVVTERVKRQIVTATILIILLLAAVIGLSFALGMPPILMVSTTSFAPLGLGRFVLLILLSLLLAFMPYVLALVKIINDPKEKKINEGFIADAVRILRGQPSLRILGITGSYGKTSVKYYVTTLLSEKFNVLMTPESFNTPMGIVRTIREKMKPTDEIFVCEMGARHVGDITEITDFVHPNDGVVTSIGEQHLETFHCLENIIDTKYSLLESIPADGLRFVNGDNEVIRNNFRYPDAITYGLNEGNDFRATDIAVTPQGTSFKVEISERVKELLRNRDDAEGQVLKKRTDMRMKLVTESADSSKMTEIGGTITESDSTKESVGVMQMSLNRFHTVLVGAHNVQNIMGAIAVATLYGVPVRKLPAGVRRIEAVPHRLSLARHGNVTVLDDAYNSNPTGAKTALETLALFDGCVKILVTPGMVELGTKEAELNKQLGMQAATVCDYIILVGSKRTQPIWEGILEGGFDKEKLFVKETFAEASKLMYEMEAGKEKVILLENDLPDNY